jgi:hypothetical protein
MRNEIIEILFGNISPKMSPCRYPYFAAMMGLAWSYDPESHASISTATGRVSHAEQVKDDDPEKKKRIHGPSRLEVGHGIDSPIP